VGATGPTGATGITGPTVGTEPSGRLTNLTGAPVQTTSTAGATSIYFTPYNGNTAPFWDGSNWGWEQFTELSQALTDTTKSPAAAAASSCYDIFLWKDAGVKRISRGPAWTNLTTRGYTLTRQNGYLVNTSIITNGPAALFGLYLGTIATNASSTLDYTFGASASGGIAAVFNVWNNFNRRLTTTRVTDSGAPYNYGSATIRQARASAGNQITFVSGLAEDGVSVSRNGSGVFAAALVGLQLGVGLDSTTAYATMFTAFISASTNYYFAGSNVVYLAPQLGSHVISANESTFAGTIGTFNTNAIDSLMATIYN
jgi:hypothetical protein